MRPMWRRSHVFEFVLLLTGIVFITFFVWDQIDTRLEQRQANQELEEQIRARQSAKPPAAAEPAPEQPGNKAARPPREKLNRGDTIGRIEVPRLKIKAVVRSGVDDKTLKRAVGHVPSTPLPGEAGNVGLAAHRDTFFRNLKGVRKGDEIRVVTAKGNYVYTVESTMIVMPKNVEVLDPTKENALTLVTCYPFNYVGSAPQRFIVRARQATPQGETVAGGL